jgi:hypothetical protein
MTAYRSIPRGLRGRVSRSERHRISAAGAVLRAERYRFSNRAVLLSVEANADAKEACGAKQTSTFHNKGSATQSVLRTEGSLDALRYCGLNTVKYCWAHSAGKGLSRSSS